MRPLRRFLARTLLAPFLLLPLLSCGYPKPSPKAVAAALARASTFTEPRMVVIPRRVEAHTSATFGGGVLDDRQLVVIDPVVAILHANKIVDVQDAYAPEGSTGGYFHILTIAPGADQPAELFIETDEPPNGPEWSWRQMKKIPGWRVTLGRREVTNVSQVFDSSSPTERISPGYVLAYFDFHWIPSDIGKLFDQGSLGFDDLPNDLQRATVQAGALDSRATYNGRAYLTRDKTGDWKVTMFECRRCPGAL